jgi:hypothetical protein
MKLKAKRNAARKLRSTQKHRRNPVLARAPERDLAAVFDAIGRWRANDPETIEEADKLEQWLLENGMAARNFRGKRRRS